MNAEIVWIYVGDRYPRYGVGKAGIAARGVRADVDITIGLKYLRIPGCLRGSPCWLPCRVYHFASLFFNMHVPACLVNFPIASCLRFHRNLADSLWVGRVKYWDEYLVKHALQF